MNTRKNYYSTVSKGIKSGRFRYAKRPENSPVVPEKKMPSFEERRPPHEPEKNPRNVISLFKDFKEKQVRENPHVEIPKTPFYYEDENIVRSPPREVIESTSEFAPPKSTKRIDEINARRRERYQERKMEKAEKARHERILGPIPPPRPAPIPAPRPKLQAPRPPPRPARKKITEHETLNVRKKLEENREKWNKKQVREARKRERKIEEEAEEKRLERERESARRIRSEIFAEKEKMFKAKDAKDKEEREKRAKRWEQEILEEEMRRKKQTKDRKFLKEGQKLKKRIKEYQKELKKWKKQLEKERKKHQKELEKERKKLAREFEKQRKRDLRQEQTKWAKEIRKEEARVARFQAKRGIFKARAKEVSSAHNRNWRKYVIENKIRNSDVLRFLDNAEPAAKKLMVPTMKIKFKLEITFQRLDSGLVVEEVVNFFSSHVLTLIDITQVDTLWSEAKEDLLLKLANFEREKSGWRIKHVDNLYVETFAYDPLRGSSYVRLPSWLKNKEALINIKNKDNKCFAYSIVRANDLKRSNNNRVDRRLVLGLEKYNWTGIMFPTTFEHFKIFEKNNPDVKLSVYTTEKKNEFEPVYLGRNEGADKIVRLLWYKGHFTLITSLSRLLSRSLASKNKLTFCERCLTHFRRESQLTSHKPSGVCLHVVRFDGKNQTYRDTCLDPAEAFTRQLEKITKEWYDEFKCPKKMKNLQEAQRAMLTATRCYVCEGELIRDARHPDFDNLKPVRDHCHFTGEFRGIAHNKCNLLLKAPKTIPVIAHNAMGYDMRLFFRDLANKKGSIDIIAKNEENFITLSKEVVVDTYIDKETNKEKEITRKLVFLDSFKFMSMGLDKLIENLPKEKFFELKKSLASHENKEEEFELLTRKGVFPYDWFTGPEKLKERSLPPKEEFYSKLNKKGISDKDYAHAQKVWNTFGCGTIFNYHELYMTSDTLALADIFEEFRNMALENYGLDPVYYFTAPGMAWDAMLKKTGVQLDLLTEPQSEMYLMVEAGIRGGISTILHRHSQANNPYMKNFDKDKETKYIKYYDANNLYGWAMSQALPTGGFKWMDSPNLWNQLPPGKGCILEVDLDYPKELHDLHNEFPCAAMHLNGKLIPTLWGKEKMVVHHRTLQTYLDLGLKLIKIHKALEFDESPWLKEYIDLNTRLRTASKNDFEKDFFKLMNNSVFGKTIENIRNRVDIRVSLNDNFAKLTSKVNFAGCNNLTPNLSLIHLRKTKMKMCKPIYVGMSILDLSKTLIYNFHYGYIKKKFGVNAKLLFTDTDSLCYEIKTSDVYADIKPDIQTLFDTSNYEKDNPYNFPLVNKKVIGLMKDEYGGRIIKEFIGLRSKLYNIEGEDGGGDTKCKGVKKSVKKAEIRRQDFIDCLYNNKNKEIEQNLIRSRNHTMYTESMKKTALSSNDDKRVILEDKISTLAWGHWRNE